MVLIAYAPHLAVIFADGVIITLDAHCEMALILTEFIRLWMVAQPGKLKAELLVGGADKYNLEGSVGMVNLLELHESESLVIEFYTAVKVSYIEVDVVEMCFYVHIVL